MTRHQQRSLVVFVVLCLAAAPVLAGQATRACAQPDKPGDLLAIDFESLLNVTVIGGTGRFEGATGSWTEVSHFAFPFGATTVDPYVAELKGTISTPGANKK